MIFLGSIHLDDHDTLQKRLREPNKKGNPDLRRNAKELGFRLPFIPDHNSWRETSFSAISASSLGFQKKRKNSAIARNYEMERWDKKTQNFSNLFQLINRKVGAGIMPIEEPQIR